MPIPDAVLASLTRSERRAVRLAWRANTGRLGRWCAAFERVVSPHVVGLYAGRVTRLRGLSNVEATDPARPVLLVANHRSWFDLAVVARALCLHTDRVRALHFPVRGRFFYQDLRGLAINAAASQFAMFPPFFMRAETRVFDRWALDHLAALCRDGAGRFVGFHPEGRRNRDADEWSLLPAQPGIGHLIHIARPQVVPVWVAGLSNDVALQLRANWRGTPPARVRFGATLDLAALCDTPPRLRSYAAISGAVMAAIATVGAADRAECGGPPG